MVQDDHNTAEPLQFPAGGTYVVHDADARHGEVQEEAAGRHVDDDGPVPRWIDVVTMAWYNPAGFTGPLRGDDRRAAEAARVIMDRIRAGNGRPGDVMLDGWAIGALATDHYGLREDGRPKVDNRWLGDRPPVPREDSAFLHLNSGLRLYHLAPVDVPDAERAELRRSVLLHPHVAAILRAYPHPRPRALWGDAEGRRAVAEDRWRREDTLMPPCDWCGMPTGGMCLGVAQHFCRLPTCTSCAGIFGRCIDCVRQLGVPSMPEHNPETPADIRIANEGRYHDAQIAQLMQESWWDVI